MKAQVGDFIKATAANANTKCCDRPLQVIDANAEHGYLLENGAVIADDQISLEDVLLESEVFH